MTRFLKASGWVAQLAGMAAVVDGVWRVSVPAALIVAGVLVFVAAELLDRGAA